MQAAGPVPADTTIEITLVLRRRAELPDPAAAAPIPAVTLAADYGADPADVDLVTATVTALGARVLSVHAAARLVRVEGTAATLTRMFGTSLDLVTSQNPAGVEVTHRVRTTALSVPAVLDGIVTAVLGLDDRPQARPRFRVARPHAVSTSYTPVQLGRIYRFPAGTDGAGQTIAIIEFGGGFTQSDLDTYFAGLGISAPTVTAVGVDGGANAPGARPQRCRRRGAARHRGRRRARPGRRHRRLLRPQHRRRLRRRGQRRPRTPRRRPTAISISWGQSEDAVDRRRPAPPSTRRSPTRLLLGVTVTVAAGDDGSADGATDGRAHVDFPASSPHALACGGTRLRRGPGVRQVAAETVWNNGAGSGATGGGVSDAFALPTWQAGAGVPRRRHDGRARCPGRRRRRRPADRLPGAGRRHRHRHRRHQRGGPAVGGPGRPGWPRPRDGRSGCCSRRCTPASRPAAPRPDSATSPAAATAAYSAGPGWDACTGLGVPDGTALLTALQPASHCSEIELQARGGLPWRPPGVSSSGVDP